MTHAPTRCHNRMRLRMALSRTQRSRTLRFPCTTAHKQEQRTAQQLTCSRITVLTPVPMSMAVLKRSQCTVAQGCPVHL